MSRPSIKHAAPLPLLKTEVGWGEPANPNDWVHPRPRLLAFVPQPNLRGTRQYHMERALAVRQRGASLVMAIFLITALAALGGLLMQLLVLGSEETINEWYSAQALYAAESGVGWAARDISAGGSGSISNGVVLTDRAWMTTTVSPVSIGGRTLYTITSTGSAGGVVVAPRAQRRIVVQFMP